jgi:hypothetical protein
MNSVAEITKIYFTYKPTSVGLFIMNFYFAYFFRLCCNNQVAKSLAALKF